MISKIPTASKLWRSRQEYKSFWTKNANWRPRWYLWVYSHVLAKTEEAFVHQNIPYHSWFCFLQHTHRIRWVFCVSIRHAQSARKKRNGFPSCPPQFSLISLGSSLDTVWEEQVSSFVQRKRTISWLDWLHIKDKLNIYVWKVIWGENNIKNTIKSSLHISTPKLIIHTTLFIIFP